MDGDNNGQRKYQMLGGHITIKKKAFFRKQLSLPL
jgi:hypothetical protein